MSYRSIQSFYIARGICLWHDNVTICSCCLRIQTKPLLDLKAVAEIGLMIIILLNNNFERHYQPRLDRTSGIRKLPRFPSGISWTDSDASKCCITWCQYAFILLRFTCIRCISTPSSTNRLVGLCSWHMQQVIKLMIQPKRMSSHD